MAIITSLLDQDLYKLTMMQAVLHQFPGAHVKYEFKCRNINNLSEVISPSEIEWELDVLCSRCFLDDELEYLRSIRFFKPDFLDFLRIFRLDQRFVKVSVANNSDLKIEIEGPWLHTILFEVFVLAIINERFGRKHSELAGESRLKAKAEWLLDKPIGIVEFGTRRRHSAAWQHKVYETLIKAGIRGTSNVLLAKKTNTKPYGTMAHEWLQAGQALGPRLRDSQAYMLEAWVKEYRGDLGIALTDVIGVDAFLQDFDLYFAKLYDGVRHDSGCPMEFAKKVILHYEKLGIDPLTKQIVFSDSLDFEKAAEIQREFQGDIRVSFGIGTFLTNDMGYRAPNTVIKMTMCNGQPVAKISDSPGKSMCKDEQYVSYLKKVFGGK